MSSITQKIPTDTSYLSMTTSLLDLMPDPTLNNGVFDYLNDLSYIDPPSNNMEYLYNRSGEKVPSPLVDRLADGDTLTTQSLQSLAKIIRIRFRNKWDKLWEDYASESGLFDNVNLKTETVYGKTIAKSGTDTLTKSGTETSIRTGDETMDESYPETRKSTRTITGKYTDHRNITNTRTGAENTTESFPSNRVSTKSITGGYADSDTTANTRTGSELVTDKGDTADTTFGFNSSTGVKTHVVGPDNAATGTTTETSYGESGLKDQKSGAITRAYNEYKESTTETGTRQLSTSYGEKGLSDAESGDVTRTYDNYKDEMIESGQKRNKKSYNNLTDSHSFANRQDARSISGTDRYSGTDTVSQSGYNIRRLSDKFDILTAMYENPLLNNFYEIVYRDIDEVLTCPIFV